MKTLTSHFKISAIISAILLVLVSADYSRANQNGVGLGVIIGEPTGPTFKFWTGRSTAIDGALAWSFDRNNELHLQMNYLFHEFGAINVNKGRMPFYYGIGGRLKFHDDNRDDEFGVRVPAGLSYLFANSPVELFFEVVPIVNLAPDTELDFNGGIGIRYYLGK